MTRCEIRKALFDLWRLQTYILCSEFLSFQKSAEECWREVICCRIISSVQTWDHESSFKLRRSTTLSLSTLPCHQRHKNNIDTWWQSHHAVVLLGFGYITKETGQIITNCRKSGKAKIVPSLCYLVKWIIHPKMNSDICFYIFIFCHFGARPTQLLIL